MTTKLMFLVWGDASALQGYSWNGDSLHARLADAGVLRLQVNLDDLPDALRLQTSDTPITAVVSVWTDGDVATVVDVLSSAAGQVAGYEVDEHRPLDPPEAWDGSRADALANMAVLRRPDELPRDEWLARWLGPHTQVAIETQATFGYLQNVVLHPLTPGAPRVDAIVEELFPPEAVGDIHAFYGSGGDDGELSRRLTRLMESVATIGADRDLDLVPTSRWLYAF